MNFYLYIVVALGVIAGATEVPVARPALAGVVSRREARRSAIASTGRGRTAWRIRSSVRNFGAPRAAVRLAAAFFSASAPRAPAFG